MSEKQVQNVLTQKEAQSLCRAAFRLLKNWELSDAEVQVLLGGDEAAFKNEQQSPNENILVRAHLLLGIHKQLRVLFFDKWRGYQWVKKPNQIFNGMSALDVMMQRGVEGILQVKEYLEAENAH
ncbi:MbcA/ParS/Xre antitoxin family protein [Thalassospira sp. CH_XMU1458]|uniref:MbcA/ParS/Xre antitoxin family protein n=1 Tax=Thalassospira sp. CH_XMU1458 TaxID=3107776 RepID=UPI00300C7374